MSRLCRQTRELLTLSMRNAIREKFIELASASAEVTMDTLAAALGIAKGTLYLYYKTKDDLLEDAMSFHREKMFEEMRRRLETVPSPSEQLSVFAEVLIGNFVRNRFLRMEFIRSHPLSHPSGPNRNHEILCAILERGIAAGEFRDVSVPDSAMFLRCALIGQFRYHLVHDLTPDPVKLLATFRDLSLAALQKR